LTKEIKKPLKPRNIYGVFSYNNVQTKKHKKMARTFRNQKVNEFSTKKKSIIKNRIMEEITKEEIQKIREYAY